MMKLGNVITVALTLSLIGIAPGAAQEKFPSKPIQIVVPYAAGGVTDVIARVVGEQLAKPLGQPVVVVNRTGAGGTIGLESVFRAPHDGYTIAMMPANIVTMPVLYPKLTFDPVRDFTPIVLLGTSPSGIAAHVSLGFKSLKDMITYAKAHPGKLSYASCGIASPQHLAAEYLKKLAGIEITHIPYRGCNDANADVLAGRVQLFFATIPHLIRGQQTGKINALAVTGKSRTEWTPNVPTAFESGYPDLVLEAWFGLLAPRGTPKEIITRINVEVNKILAKPDVQKHMKQQFFTAAGGSVESFGKLIMSDADQLGAIAKEAGIKIE